MAVVGLYLMVSPWLHPPMIKVLLLSMLGAAFLAGYVMTIKTKCLKAFSHHYIVCLYLTLFANATVTGGIGAPGTVWFVLCPLISFITLSTRFARVGLMIILVTVVGFYIFEETVALTEFEDQKRWYLVSYLLFFPMVYFILKVFRREVSKRNIALTALNQRLEVERKMLQKSQEALLQKSERLKKAETSALERSAKLSYYLDQLIEVKRMEELHIGSLQYSIRAVTQFLVRAMDLDNVTVWRARPGSQSLELVKYFGNTKEELERAVISRREFVDAYDMLETGAIVVGNVQSKETDQIRSVYMRTPGSDSMINCPFFINERFGGFISCRATERSWSQEDLIFVRAISDTIPLAFKSHERRVQQNLLEAKQREITMINGSLEKKVKERTILLNQRNKQLTDFAFTNAHHIRGPICRLLGLKNLLSITDNCREVMKIADYMSASVEELDQITRETSAALNTLVAENE